ncbi:MAG TPA: malto-oligosyltrehalose trehalohydrolase, partial [Vicinamibacterales bacterium]|nr:malto-oligosyltrehalose trehalohydrolase [Vicinamibacterales bacterium]
MWQPSLGAWVTTDGVRFRVWAPEIAAVDLVVESGAGTGTHRLTREGNDTDGFHTLMLAGVADGDRYRYRLDGGPGLPDPASRYQPEGVHGPSQVVDPSRFRWLDEEWCPPTLHDLIIYEVHVGTFSPSGRFDGVTERLPLLAQLGVTAIELMPVADFSGGRGWGYDGVDLFAPSRAYGAPDDLRRLVDTAHRLGLAVLLDVVYNHLGPDGAYLGAFSPYYFTTKHESPWGAGVNLDGEHSAAVRAFFIENARHWLHEYHIDGLRLDATHALADDSPRHFLAELTDVLHAEKPSAILVAEDSRNLRTMIMPTADGGWGLDGVWADDFHHQVRRRLAGDDDGYYRDYTGRLEDLARTIDDGWLYRGQHSVHAGGPRGTDPTGLPRRRFVVCLQNHDQIGNRAFGDRLSADIEAPAFRAASALLLCLPETPLMFMGQEWNATSPFLYFTDHHEELGTLVTDGRRNEFRHFARFADPDAATRIPDPQAKSTFEDSRLRWDERAREPHAGMLRLYQALIALRRQEPALRGEECRTIALDDQTLLMWRGWSERRPLAILVRFGTAGQVTIDRTRRPGAAGHRRWRPRITTEDPDFAQDPR